MTLQEFKKLLADVDCLTTDVNNYKMRFEIRGPDGFGSMSICFSGVQVVPIGDGELVLSFTDAQYK